MSRRCRAPSPEWVAPSPPVPVESIRVRQCVASSVERDSPERGDRIHVGAVRPDSWRHFAVAEWAEDAYPLVRVTSARDQLPHVRRHESGCGGLLRHVRSATPRSRRAARAAEDRERAVLRRDGLDRPRRASRPGGDAGRDGPLLRHRARRDRAAWRHGREIHRRCGHGHLRRPAAARGRRPPSRARRARAARRRRARRPHRREHG